jgi:hypothetical protein
MTNLKFVFLGLLALNVVAASSNAWNWDGEFLFNQNMAPDDKYFCLHRMLYRNEKLNSQPKAPLGRILSMKRILADDTSTNALAAYLGEAGRLTFTLTISQIQALSAKIAERGSNSEYIMSDEFKKLVASVVNNVYATKRATGGNDYLTSDKFTNDVIAELDKQINDIASKLGPYRLQQAASNNISRDRVIYLLINIFPLFKEDPVATLKAYDDYFGANVAQISGAAMNSKAMIRWIESIKLRYKENRVVADPNADRLLEPFTVEGFLPGDTPSGSFEEPVPSINQPNPQEIDEKEPTSIISPQFTDDIRIPDLLIEIQRTYNIEKMLLTYSQITQRMRQDVDACGLRIMGAIERCEKVHGFGNCEAVTTTLANRKCPQGYVREGCCNCVADCNPNDFDTINRSFCQMKNTLYVVPAIAPLDNSGTFTRKEGLGMAIGGCPEGFTINKFICYKTCPAGTTAIGASTCLKNKPINVGAPFAWTAGDE